MSYTQFKYLFKREIQAARRTRGIMLMIIFMPIIMWGFQIVLPLIRIGVVNTVDTSIIKTSAPSNVANPLDVSIDLGLPIMIAIILTFLSTIPYIAASIAGEREKRTLESLLSLPISRHQILLAKFAAGSILGSISVILNLVLMWIYILITNMIIAPVNDWSSAAFEINLNLELLPIMSLTLFLCMFLNLGIGISIASLSKSAETSRQLFSLLLFPIMLFISITLFTGIPEMWSVSMNSLLPLLLYFIPWMHALAILQKTLIPTYFNTNRLFLLPLEDLTMDIIFHLLAILSSIFLVMWISSKVFEREGLVS